MEQKMEYFGIFCITCLLDLYSLQGNALMEEGKDLFELQRVTKFLQIIYVLDSNSREWSPYFHSSYPWKDIPRIEYFLQTLAYKNSLSNPLMYLINTHYTYCKFEMVFCEEEIVALFSLPLSLCTQLHTTSAAYTSDEFCAV